MSPRLFTSSIVRLDWHEIYKTMFYRNLLLLLKFLSIENTESREKFGTKYLSDLASFFDLFGFECFFCYVWILDFLRFGSDVTNITYQNSPYSFHIHLVILFFVIKNPTFRDQIYPPQTQKVCFIPILFLEIDQKR